MISAGVKFVATALDLESILNTKLTVYVRILHAPTPDTGDSQLLPSRSAVYRSRGFIFNIHRIRFFASSDLDGRSLTEQIIPAFASLNSILLGARHVLPVCRIEVEVAESDLAMLAC